jgi:hypothetical protein
MTSLVCLGVVAALVGLQGQGLPVPRKLVEARTAYLANAGVELSAFEELHKQLRVWGRLTFADDESHADIVITLDRERPAAATSGVDQQAWVLRINAPGTTTPLHGDREEIVGNGFSGIKLLVGRLMKLVDTATPSSPASQTSPTSSEANAPTAESAMASSAMPSTTATAATAAREPCRVFVTEAPVNPSWFTAIKKIKYSKKWYGSGEVAYRALAQQAWKLDADAVVDVNLNFRPSMWSWASPHADGTAVKWTEEGRKQWSSLFGQCFGRDANNN